MFRNYLLSALRNAVRQKLYTFINLAGLAIGLACAIFIGLFVWDELSYDRWIPQSRDLYRVQVTFAAPGVPTMQFPVAPFPLGEAMNAAIPEIDAFTRSVAESVTTNEPLVVAWTSAWDGSPPRFIPVGMMQVAFVQTPAAS